MIIEVRRSKGFRYHGEAYKGEGVQPTFAGKRDGLVYAMGRSGGGVGGVRVYSADYNNDGFLDLLVKDGIGNERDNGTGSSGAHTLFRNTANGNHFVKINLQGVQSNRQGIGARVTVVADSLTCFRQNLGDGGGNYYSQGNLPIHVGIGAAAAATITVAWPSGVVDVVSDVPANSTIPIVER